MWKVGQALGQSFLLLFFVVALTLSHRRRLSTSRGSVQVVCVEPCRDRSFPSPSHRTVVSGCKVSLFWFDGLELRRRLWVALWRAVEQLVGKV